MPGFGIEWKEVGIQGKFSMPQYLNVMNPGMVKTHIFKQPI